MKYDNHRAITLASVFSLPRYSNTEGETITLDRMAQELALGGWTVSRESLVGRSPRNRLMRLMTFGTSASLLAIASFNLGQRLWPISAFCLLWGARIILKLSFWSRLSFGWPQTRSARVVQASGDIKPNRPQVIIRTHVATPPRRFVGRGRWVVVGLVLGSAVLVEILARSSASGSWGSLLILGWIVLLSGLVLLVFEPVRNGGGPGLSDNRTGLALLVELAKSWPTAARNRVNVRFEAIGGSHEMAFSWTEPLPSLVIELINPGSGSLLSLAGTETALKLASDAARDLWIPFFLTIPHDDTEPSSLLIEGIRGSDTPDDPTFLSHAAQFVVEFALRWGKRQITENAALIGLQAASRPET